MNEFKCPYCKASNSLDVKACINCGEGFPWMVNDESLKNLIRERETNIMRATVTIFEELYQSTKESRPFNLAVVRGFINAYFFNRSVFIVGSILGIVAVCFQTGLIYLQYKQINEQNQLIEVQNQKFDRQNTFVAFEQTTNLRNFLFKDRFLNGNIWHWPRPNPSSVGQIIDLASKEPEIIVPALNVLIKDESKSVATAAVEALAGIINLEHKHMDSLIYLTTFKNIILGGGDLNNAVLDNCNFEAATLIDMNLCGCSLTNCNFTKANLSATEMSYANFAKSKLLNATLWRTDIRGTDFSRADLAGARLWEAEAFRANFSEANLTNSSLKASNFSEANFTKANLAKADFSKASLAYANLSQIRHWNKIYKIMNANIFGVKNAPNGFREWALKNGAIEVESKNTLILWQPVSHPDRIR